ncbi:zinc finger protein 518A [Brachionichthys hirsutus]|uniref:zinc finger protein 518A n=1 Tax=Brachionichthys hirsutus TaxID=412623 RepID=UPI0036052AE5
MERDLTIPCDSAQNGNISVKVDEKEKVKTFVYKHFREVTDGSLFSNADDSAMKAHGSSTKKPSLSKAHCKIQQGAVFSGKILSFGCSVCGDDSTYSPNDLLKHFRAAHKKTLPTYPCDLCDFVTREFPALQRHRIEHRNTLVTCALCNNDVQYSLLLLTRHYIMCHSLNGQFTCDWCDFTTMDAGTFVQHIHHHNESPWKCSKCSHISLNEEDHQKHMKAHSGTFPFTCQICGYGAARSEHLKKHTAAVHKVKSEKRNAWNGTEDCSTPANSPGSLKLQLKRSGDSQEAQRMAKFGLSGSLANQNGRLIKPDISLEEIQHIGDGVDNNNWSKGLHNSEQSVPVMFQECDSSASSDASSHISQNGLTVLMVKNKISLPPNCTTKVMGFKMVDGKKHLVLKVIPVKQDPFHQNHSSGEDVFSITPGVPQLDKSKDTSDDEECTNSKNSTSPCFTVSPRSESCLQVDQDDIMAVKVKIEEEETSVCNLNPSPQSDDNDGEECNTLQNRSSNCTDTLNAVANTFDHMTDQSHKSRTCPERCKLGSNLTLNSDVMSHNGLSATDLSRGCPVNAIGLSSPSMLAQEALLSKAENGGAADELSKTDAVAEKCNIFFDTTKSNRFSQSAPENENLDRIRDERTNKIGQQNLKKFLTNSEAPSESSKLVAAKSNVCTTGTQNSPRQEVFTFHNYSKEKFSPSSAANQNSDNVYESSASPHFSLTLAESPEPFTEIGSEEELSKETNLEDSREVTDSDTESDACIEEEPPTEDENPESVLQDFNIIKIEEENIPITNKQAGPSSNTASLDTFVEKHSDAIIAQQLNKERVDSSCASIDSLKQTKTTLRIVQLPEGKQSLLLRTAENRFSKPLQLKAPPGFKLITNSSNPQINVSYMKPGLDKSNSTPCGRLTPNNVKACVLAPKAGAADKGVAPQSAVQPGVSTTSSHYFINNPGFKGPVFLSSTKHSTTTDKTAKTQPTCYVLQRSVPFGQNPSTPALKLASTQLQLNSRPVLAMPAGTAEKPNTLQTGRQAFLLRYISPPKSSLLLNNQDAKNGTRCGQINESPGNKVIFKIVSPTGSILTSGAPTSSSQPLFLASRPQTQCFLVSSNKTNANASSAVKRFITIQNSAQRDGKGSFMSTSRMNVKLPLCETEKSARAPRPVRPPSQRKRRRKRLFDELPATVHKARRFTNRMSTEQEMTELWEPVAKDVEMTLRLAPFNSQQEVRCPRRCQPVVVLNHPDAEIPEVANIMKVVQRYKGAVTKVALSKKTVQALLDLGTLEKSSSTKGASSCSDSSRPRPVQSSVQERFLLKLKLRKKSKKKYEVMKDLSSCRQDSVVFDCWFCGRLFHSQEDWIGHGQRHLMEATRDWNKLF